MDNAGDPDVMRDYLPQGSRGNVIYTSKNEEHALSLAEGACCPVNEMEEDEAVTLLKRSARRDELSEEDARLARSIVAELGHLALAINQAGALVFMGVCNLDDFLGTFRNHRKELMEKPSYKAASKSEQAVYTTWDISYVRIHEQAQIIEGDLGAAKEAENAIQILNLFAQLHNENIMEEIFKKAAENWAEGDRKNKLAVESETRAAVPLQLLRCDQDGRWDHLPFRQGVRLLFSLSLIRQDEPRRYYSMHRLVHFWAQDRLSEADRQNHISTTRALLSISIKWTFQTEDYAFRRKLLPHIHRCQNPSPKTNPLIENTQDATKFALVYFENGNMAEAEALQAQALELCKSTLEPQHPDTLASMANLASTFWNQGRWTKAEALQAQALELCKSTLGPKHPHTLTSMANLASTFSSQGRWTEAEALQAQALELCKSTLGPEHPDTLASMGNLALTFWNQGRWTEAEALQAQALELCKSTLGPEHPGTLTSMANLALTFSSQGRWTEAEALQAQALELSKSTLGPEHPHTLTSMGNLASTFSSQGRWTEAEALETQALELCKSTLGPEHRDTLASMGNLALTFWNQGRWTKAEVLQAQALELSKSTLGPEHPGTLTSMGNLASTFSSQGRWTKAEALEAQVLELRKRTLGPEHPDTLSSMANLAYIYYSSNRAAEAVALMEDAVKSMKRVIGENHPDTIGFMGLLRDWQGSMQVTSKEGSVKRFRSRLSRLVRRCP